MVALLKRTGEVIGMHEYSDDQSQVEAKLDSDVKIKMENASISWGFSIKKKEDTKDSSDQATSDVNLKNINFEASTGQLVAIIGTVG